MRVILVGCGLLCLVLTVAACKQSASNSSSSSTDKPKALIIQLHDMLGPKNSYTVNGHTVHAEDTELFRYVEQLGAKGLVSGVELQSDAGRFGDEELRVYRELESLGRRYGFKVAASPPVNLLRIDSHPEPARQYSVDNENLSGNALLAYVERRAKEGPVRLVDFRSDTRKPSDEESKICGDLIGLGKRYGFEVRFIAPDDVVRVIENELLDRYVANGQSLTGKAFLAYIEGLAEQGQVRKVYISSNSKRAGDDWMEVDGKLKQLAKHYGFTVESYAPVNYEPIPIEQAK